MTYSHCALRIQVYIATPSWHMVNVQQILLND